MALAVVFVRENNIGELERLLKVLKRQTFHT